MQLTAAQKRTLNTRINGVVEEFLGGIGGGGDGASTAPRKTRARKETAGGKPGSTRKRRKE